MTKRPRVFVSGPMEGIADHNYPAFHAAAQRLRDHGYKVTNPAELFDGRMDLGRNDYLAGCIKALIKCDNIAMLDGWRGHEGAETEEHIARAMRMQRVCPYSCHLLPTWLQAA